MRLVCKVYSKKEFNKIELCDDFSLKIFIKEVREKGRANKALIEIISDTLLIKKYNIKIISGFTTLNKIVQIITNKTKEDLLSILR